MYLLTVLFGTTLFHTIYPAKLPSYFPRCYQDDQNINECFISAANSLNENVRSGIPEIGLHQLDPFVAPNLNLTLESPITDLYVSVNDLNLDRLYNYHFTAADIRPKEGVITGTVILPDLDLWGNYRVQGHIINLPLNGGGYFKLMNDNMECDFLINDWNERGNCNKINVEITCRDEDVKVNLTGLPNGDTIIGLLNLSSKLVASEISPAYAGIFQKFLGSFLKRLCRKYPLNSLFPTSS
ncbi:hypothetical protein PPYR_03640 [Photinus pyralis]|uniref:Hemolymph juvenile hormone-binding protein n=1 Tax=Photinus pyralis TaxID=7054 RepID=A0A5N4A3D5_PHOPY|nr:uncharacterized protein LOC116161455 [Photinus pyralis]KAB0791840.1 hypothetical protein PPYR_03640 [Photinus pyralis]